MNNRKVTAIYSIHNNKIDSLRGFLSITKQMYDYQKINSSESDFLDWLKFKCFEIEVEITTTIDYYQHNPASIKTIEKAKDKCKDFSILLHKYKLELFNGGFNESEYLAYKKERKDAFDFELTNETKIPLDNYLEIKKEFEDFIKIENLQNDKAKNIIDENDLKFQVLLAFANGSIYKLQENGLSHPKKANELFNNNDKKNMIIGYIKNSYTNVSKDKDHYNKNKNLFNNTELIESVKKYCNKKGIEINSTFLKECIKNNPNE